MSLHIDDKDEEKKWVDAHHSVDKYGFILVETQERDEEEMAEDARALHTWHKTHHSPEKFGFRFFFPDFLICDSTFFSLSRSCHSRLTSFCRTKQAHHNILNIIKIIPSQCGSHFFILFFLWRFFFVECQCAFECEGSRKNGTRADWSCNIRFGICPTATRSPHTCNTHKTQAGAEHMMYEFMCLYIIQNTSKWKEKKKTWTRTTGNGNQAIIERERIDCRTRTTHPPNKMTEPSTAARTHTHRHSHKRNWKKNHRTIWSIEISFSLSTSESNFQRI